MTNQLKQPRILLDMDEVLADFTGLAIALHGWTLERLEWARVAGVWDLTRVMKISVVDFWRPINKMGKSFWENVYPLDNCYKIFNLVKQTTDDWYIVSSPSMDVENCIAGKLWWIYTYLGTEAVDRFIPTRHKHLMANPNTVLIDDKGENIQKFIEAGGQGIIYPTRGNNLHSRSNNSVKYVEKQLNQIKLEKEKCIYTSRM